MNIVALVGLAGSGKTYASLLMNNQPGFETIVSYTTRPMREGEVNGVDHYFVKLKDKPKQKDMLAYTVYGGYEYWTEKRQFSDPNKWYVYVIDETGLINLMDRSKKGEFKANIYKVKMIRPSRPGIEQSRMERDADREVIEDTFYNTVILNNGTEKHLEDLILDLCEHIKSL